MTDTTAAAFLALVSARRGHFQLESGHHASLWFDLDALFAEPKRIMPFVAALAKAIRPHRVEAVCGPLLGGGFLAQLVAYELQVEFAFTERAPNAEKGMYQTRYLLPPVFVPRLNDRRVAMVDDVMSAGSALRGTFTELQAHGAIPVVAGALMVLGTTGATYFTEQVLPVEAVARHPYELWLPSVCPLCAAGAPLEIAG